MDEITEELLRILLEMPLEWLGLLRNELRKMPLNLNNMSPAMMQKMAQFVVTQVNMDYYLHEEYEDKQADLEGLIRVVAPAPKEWIRELTESIRKQHPELERGEFISE
ncbi:MAG: hypothetical protein JW860_13895 [Sedimentisphaerales bacterium]|nr:hypothetical protein [Sedimentisphaerales bacterium]